MNRGGVGARSLNSELQAALNPAGDRKVEWFGWTFAPGDKVMQLENDYGRTIRYWVHKKNPERYLYEVSVDEVLHSGDMDLFNQGVGLVHDLERVHDRAKKYWTGEPGNQPFTSFIELMSRKSSFCQIRDQLNSIGSIRVPRSALNLRWRPSE